jgi:hypothetical protein
VFIISAVGGMGRYAVCFWVSAKITFQQTKPDDACNSVALDFSTFFRKTYGSAHNTTFGQNSE